MILSFVDMILPYRIALFIIQFLGRILLPSKTRIWARNSFRLGYFQNFKSDLDLSFLYEDPISARTAHSQFFRKIHRLFPMVCETNVYIRPHLHLIARNINFYEWQRDPDLKNFGLIDLRRSPQPFEALAFISRMMLSDFGNLKKNLSFRKKKWGFHFSQVGRSLSLERSFLEQIFDYCAEEFQLRGDEKTGMIRQFTDYAMMLQEGKHAFDLRGKMNDKVWLWTFLPHHFPFAAHEMPALTTAQYDLVYEQLRWEIFGALTQYVNFAEPIFKAQLMDCLRVIGKAQEHNPTEARWKTLTLDFQEALQKISI